MSDGKEIVLSASDRRQFMRQAETVYDLAWRVDFTAPGFAVVALPTGADSHCLRSWMVDLKERLSEIGVSRSRGRFVYVSMGRFDQQVTTKFHLDGAPERSLLMLGYEPSNVLSRLYLADFARAAFDLGITPQRFLQEYNPMYGKGEEILSRYVTELPQPAAGRPRIVLVNNSSLPFTEARTNTLGVLHKAVIVAPDESEPRIVNSTMLAVGERDEIEPERQREFVTTDEISRRMY